MPNPTVQDLADFTGAVEALLESGDTTGCDGLIVVDLEAFKALQAAAAKLNGGVQWGPSD